MLARWPLVRSSTMRTFFAPRTSSWSVSVEPMNDAPPVTKTVFPAQNPSAVVTRAQPPLIWLVNRQLIDDFHKFLQFPDSIIVGSSGPCRFAHSLQLFWVGSEGAHGIDNFHGAVRIRSYRKTAVNAQRHS